MRSTAFSSVRQTGAFTSAITTDTTLDEQDVGKVILVTVDTCVITLPAVATGYEFTIESDGDMVGFTVDPNGNDAIAGPDVTGTDAKYWQLTSATAQKGDRLKLHYANANSWLVTEKIGTFTQLA